MRYEEEHIKYDKKGNINGIWDINVEKATGDYWQKVDQIIRAYTEVHKGEMYMLTYENKQLRESRLNKYGSNKSKDLRWGAAIPPGLFFKLQQFDPMLFENKKLFHIFLRKYKGLAICKKV